MFIMDKIGEFKKSVGKKQAKEKLENTMLGVAVGLTTGAVAGVLLTPKSGKETREELVHAVKEAAVKAKEVFDKPKGHVEEATEELEKAKEKLKETEIRFSRDVAVKG